MVDAFNYAKQRMENCEHALCICRHRRRCRRARLSSCRSGRLPGCNTAAARSYLALPCHTPPLRLVDCSKFHDATFNYQCVAVACFGFGFGFGFGYVAHAIKPLPIASVCPSVCARVSVSMCVCVCVCVVCAIAMFVVIMALSGAARGYWRHRLCSSDNVTPEANSQDLSA